jgi:hypothetical protein
VRLEVDGRPVRDLEAPGARADVAYYNALLFQGGKGWLPARLEGPAGREAEPDRAAAPLPSSFFHPALELFRDGQPGGLADARFPRWWRLATPGREAAAVPVALLTGNDPFLVERSSQGGRVLLAAVPLDDSWGTNLPRLPAFAPLAHELVYYLAGARAAEHNLQPGQPLHYRPPAAHRPGPVTVYPPEGEARRLTAARWPLDYEETLETGMYRVAGPNGRTTYFVVQPDPRESDLTRCDQADREKVARLVPMTYADDLGQRDEVLSATSERQELWLWFLAGVIGLLLAEVWMTRRLVKGR